MQNERLREAKIQKFRKKVAWHKTQKFRKASTAVQLPQLCSTAQKLLFSLLSDKCVTREKKRREKKHCSFANWLFLRKPVMTPYTQPYKLTLGASGVCWEKEMEQLKKRLLCFSSFTVSHIWIRQAFFNQLWKSWSFLHTHLYRWQDIPCKHKAPHSA